MLLLLVWVGLVLGPQAPDDDPHQHVENASACFLAFVICGLWVMVQLGNLDDDPRRDLLAAAAGSSARLHWLRAATTLSALALVGLPVSLAILFRSGERSAIWLMVIFAILALGSTIGTSLGSWLTRPMMRHRGAVVLLAIAGVIGISRITPINDALATMADGDRSPLLWLLPATAALTTALIGGSARLIGRRAR